MTPSDSFSFGRFFDERPSEVTSLIDSVAPFPAKCRPPRLTKTTTRRLLIKQTSLRPYF
jgi:hypothetical protein